MAPDKYKEDLVALKHQIEEKRRIITEVLRGAAEISTEKGITLRREFRAKKLEVRTAISEALRIEEFDFWVIKLDFSGEHEKKRLLPSMLPGISATWALFDPEWRMISCIDPSQPTTFVLSARSLEVALEAHIQLSLTLIPYRPFPERDQELGEVSDVLLELPRATITSRICDLNEHGKNGILIFIRCLAVAYHEMETAEFHSELLERRFSGKFKIYDYGSFTVCLGQAEFTKSLIYAPPHMRSKLCRIVAPNEELAIRIAERLTGE
ncbi:unnamed protein product, partial [Mesorhabditis spiculigera]